MSGPTAHPSYPNPVIAEALCEIHFRPSPEHPWRPSLPGEFFRAIEAEFSTMEPVTDIGVELAFGQEGLRQTVQSRRQRMRFKHSEKPLVLQLTENVFTVNLLPRYPGWEAMRRSVLEYWERARPLLRPMEITRVGLRYINRIERRSAQERPGIWLEASDHIPPAVLRSEAGFLSRVQVRPDPRSRLIVTLGDESTDRGGGAIILDIDRIIERRVEPDDASLGRVMDQLHEDVWRAFESAKGNGLERLLQGASS